ncbi:MAG: YraN family protein [Bacteroidota bacterium]
MSIKLGQWGEKIARQYLEAQAYELLESNWRYSRAEVDIIARQGTQLIFVEVKLRKNNDFGKPETFVDRRKQSLLAEAASAYCEANNHDGEIRFDVISITGNPTTSYQLRHLEDAFFPGF